VEEGALLQPAPHALAEAGHELVGIGRLQVAHRVQPEIGQALLRARPDALQQPRRLAREARARLLAREHDEALRLLGVAGGLGHQARGADPDGDRDPGALADLGHQLAQRAQRLLDRGHVGVGLVDRHVLHRAAQALAHDVPHLLGLRAVGLEVGRQEDRVRAQPTRVRRRHGRAHPEAPRLVAGGGHHCARPAAGDHDGLAAQLGTTLQLDARVERVAVEVRDDPPWMLGRLRGQPPERTPQP
jgi:hypothetical protein